MWPVCSEFASVFWVLRFLKIHFTNLLVRREKTISLCLKEKKINLYAAQSEMGQGTLQNLKWSYLRQQWAAGNPKLFSLRTHLWKSRVVSVSTSVFYKLTKLLVQWNKLEKISSPKYLSTAFPNFQFLKLALQFPV